MIVFTCLLAIEHVHALSSRRCHSTPNTMVSVSSGLYFNLMKRPLPVPPNPDSQSRLLGRASVCLSEDENPGRVVHYHPPKARHYAAIMLRPFPAIMFPVSNRPYLDLLWSGLHTLLSLHKPYCICSVLDEFSNTCMLCSLACSHLKNSLMLISATLALAHH